MRTAVLAAAAFLAAGAHAQGQNNYGSIYSHYGLGERVDYGSSQAQMLGHAGVALRTATYATLTNPALWADQTVTTFSASASLTTTRAEDALTDGASVGTAGDVAGLHLGIPLLPGRLGMTISYRPYSRVNYRAAVRDSLVVDGETEVYTLNQEGAGGLQQISGGLGLRVGRTFQIGASADVIFGNQELLQRTDFDDATYNETRQARATRLRGFTTTLGATASTPALFAEDDVLTFGAAVTLPTSLDGSRTITLGESLDRDTLGTVVDGSADLPISIRGGLAYRSGPRWLAALEGLYEPWSGFESSLPFGGYDASTGHDLLTDRFRLGGGIEVTPAGRDRRAGAFRRSDYRIGGYAERGLSAPDGADVMTYALTGGISVPSRVTGARVDLGFEVGTRGSTEGVLVRDTFLKGTLTLNFGERWFIRRRFN